MLYLFFGPKAFNEGVKYIVSFERTVRHSCVYGKLKSKITIENCIENVEKVTSVVCVFSASYTGLFFVPHSLVSISLIEDSLISTYSKLLRHLAGCVDFCTVSMKVAD